MDVGVGGAGNRRGGPGAGGMARTNVGWLEGDAGPALQRGNPQVLDDSRWPAGALPGGRNWRSGRVGARAGRVGTKQLEKSDAASSAQRPSRLRDGSAGLRQIRNAGGP